MTFSIDNPEGGCNNPPLGKYVWEKPSGEQGLVLLITKHSLCVTRGIQWSVKLEEVAHSF